MRHIDARPPLVRELPHHAGYFRADPGWPAYQAWLSNPDTFAVHHARGIERARQLIEVDDLRLFVDDLLTLAKGDPGTVMFFVSEYRIMPMSLTSRRFPQRRALYHPGYVAGFNEYMRTEIKRRFGEDAFERLPPANDG